MAASRCVVLCCVLSALAEGGEPVPCAPQWARQYTEGLRAFRQIIEYWLDRQQTNGSFGFGLGEDVEMVVGWPGIMMATDDRRIEQALERMIDGVWGNDLIQRGYIAIATDPEHGAEPTSYSTPILLYQRFGSPRLIERLMVTAQNAEAWTGLTPAGDRHMRSSYFGSQQMYTWPFYDEDTPINARAWIPIMQLVLYNRDEYATRYMTEWADAWVRHALGSARGKPPGFLPGQVAFPTGEPGGYTNNWWGAAAHEFSRLWYQTRLHELLVVCYTVTGNQKYLEPLRKLLDFVSRHARPAVPAGVPTPPDRLPSQYAFPPGWREGDMSTQWARDLGWGHFLNWYWYVTGDARFDASFGALFDKPIERGPYPRVDTALVESAWRRAVSFRDQYFQQVLPDLRVGKGDSLANYAAAFWQKQYGTMTFGNRCFRDGGNLANSVNWPWVDFPPPSVVWKNTGYEVGIFVLADERQLFRVALCNVSDTRKTIAAQLFALDEGCYTVRQGPDLDGDGNLDSVTRREETTIRRGDRIPIPLFPQVSTLVELERRTDSGPVPVWRPRPDLGLDPWDLLVSNPRPAAGEVVAATVRIHNIGTRPAHNFAVTLQAIAGDVGAPIGEATVDALDPPQQCVPSWRDVIFSWRVPPALAARIDEVTLRADLDPRGGVDELFEGNNSASAPLVTLAAEQPTKRFVQYPPARRPSLEDVTRQDLATYVVHQTEGIVIDGTVEEAAWTAAPPFAFVAHADGKTPKKQTTMRAVYDRSALYMAFVCEEPDMALIDTDLKDIHEIYYKDGFELFVDPGAEVWRYWQFVFDTVPRQFQTLTRNEYAPKAAWEVAIAKGASAWSAEVRFPFASFGRTTPVPGERWRFNAMRYTTTFTDPERPGKRKAERSHFSPLGPLHLHHEPELFGDLWFGSARR